MPDDFEIKVSGLKETQRALYSYSQQMGDRVVIRSLLLGAKAFVRQARANAPKVTGRLQRSIYSRRSKLYDGRRTPDTLGVFVAFRPGKSRKDPKGAYYARMVEEGHKDRAGGWVEGAGFMLRAFQSQRINAANLAIAAFKAGAESVKRRVGLK